MPTEVKKKAMTATEMRKVYEKTARELHMIKDGAYCHLCGEFKSKNNFRKSYDRRSSTGLAPICKDCMEKILYRVDENGCRHSPNQESLILALKYLDRPFINILYEESIQEAEKSLSDDKDFTKIYLRKLTTKDYSDKTFLDSDFIKQRIVYADEIETKGSEDEIGTFIQGKRDRDETIRLLGYDPFNQESLSDQPFLYSQLLGMLDSSEDSNEDMMRVQSIISIVRMFLQNSKLDDKLSELMSDYNNIAKNSGTIKDLQDAKVKINSSITKLAQESCISLKNSKNATKGENTWTGKIKKLRDLNLRDAQVNGFDYQSCLAFEQVADISNASIIKQLKLDESEYADMIAEQRNMIYEQNKKVGAYKEISRILLRENLDLKDLLNEKGIDIQQDTVNISELYAQHGVGLQNAGSDGDN